MRLRSFLASLLGPSILACSALEADVSTSEAAHTEGEPTFAQHPWLWADETEDEFKRYAEATSEDGSPKFLASDDPMVERIQFWADRIDQGFRRAYGEKMRGTPRPRVIVKKTPTLNAWVSGIPVVWNVATRLAGVDARAGDAPPSTDTLLIERAGTVWAAGGLFERSHDDTQLSEFVKFHNDGFARCHLSLANGAVVFGEGCARDPSITTGEADRLAYVATGKFVTITTELIRTVLDEDRVIATLAHELGHYYRSHTNMPTDVVNYFYALGDGNDPRKPAPDPRYVEQTVKARYKLNGYVQDVDFSEENHLMTEQRLGFYTTEQEADELALEALAKIGIPPGVAIELNLSFLRDQGVRPGEIDWAECAMLREQGWRDPRGEPVSVPVGDLRDPHHSNCFRAFNMSREIAVHHYVVGERLAPPGEPWPRLVARLSAEAAETPSAGNGAPADAGAD